ncbi:non-ribosomal peptide synthetase [Paenibacillus paeoniae]|uniref:Amino acid adenylation domain-containing protein n=1 Tax=Paenibacillus paeoniae TaxID=2292705 RepID=A0A371PFV2_9BACL|nr:non-ribosomal peptide synthetase [Paenibacillus paeoniae]REK74755.1 amino acid adenylation domain-containing protein [Paenibacillus paeoniae]
MELSRDNVKDMYHLTPMQKGIFYHYLRDRQSLAYFEQMTLSLAGSISLDRLQLSFQALVEKYDMFRTVFLHQGLEQPLQVVMHKRICGLAYEDVSHLPLPAADEYVKDYQERDRLRGFDLSSDVLIRAALIRTGESDYRLLLSHHHILMDGWCVQLVLGDLFGHYRRQRMLQPQSIERSYSFSEYIKWLGKRPVSESLDYWERTLSGYGQQATLPRRMKQEGTYRQERISLTWDREVTAALKETAMRHRVTVNHVMQALWGLLLQRYAGTDDVVFGTVVSGRPPEIEGIEQMVGLFINTIPVRMKSEPGMSFYELAASVHGQLSGSQNHHHVSLADIQQRTGSRQSLIDHLFIFQNYPLDMDALSGDPDETGFRISGMDVFEQTHYDLHVMVRAEEETSIQLTFNSNVYDPAMMVLVGEHWLHTAKQIILNPSIKVEELDLLTANDRTRLSEFQGVLSPIEPRSTVHGQVEARALLAPELTAVVQGDRRITYNELIRRASVLAAELRRQGMQPGSVAGIMMDRSIEFVISIIAALKAGGAFLPIEANLPQERIRHMLEDSGCSFVLVSNRQPESMPVLNDRTIIRVPDAGAHLVELVEWDDWKEEERSAFELFNVIYTSGTTGQPKGVMLEHRTMLNLLQSQNDLSGIDFSGKVTQYAANSFDVCYQEIFSALAAGGELHIVPDSMKKDLPSLFAMVQREEIGVLFLPSSLVKFAGQDSGVLDLLPVCIEHIVAAGEQLIVGRQLRQWLRHNGVRLHNHYGPSETHVVTMLTLEPKQDISELPPIGKPIHNTRAYIMDTDYKQRPAGVPGELWIAGDSVARGYMNRPDLTEQRFSPDPFVGGARMYRTGDLARWLPDGTLEYLGRMDDQVKIRGFRIELSEVERAVLHVEGVSAATVQAYSDASGERSLCAYYKSEAPIPVSDWRVGLSRTLLEPMIPAYFIRMDSIPVTLNGKIDKRALPKPAEHEERLVDYVPPTNETEKSLVHIWQDVLGSESIGIDDHFFDCGGHSLKAMRVISRIHQIMNRTVPISALFEHETIRKLASYMNEALQERFPASEGMNESARRGESASPSIREAPKQAYYPATSSQNRIYVLSGMQENSTVYNIPSALLLEGTVESERLSKALAALVRRHDILRTALVMQEGEPVQVIQEEAELVLEEIAGEGRSEEEHIRLFLRPFDLSQAPLVRVALVHLGQARSLLLTDMHHSIADGVSMGIWAEELMQQYDGGPERAKPRIQYKDYAIWQQEQLAGEAMQAQERYWLSQFAGELPVLELPTDKPRPPLRSFAGDRITFSSGAELGGKLKRLAEETGATLHMLLLAAYNVLLSRYTGQTDIVVGTPVAGRDAPETEGLIGMFVHTLALRNKQEPEQTFRAFVEKVKRHALEAYEHQHYPFEKLVERVQPQRDMSRHALYDVMLVVQNMELPPYRLGGLKVTPYPVEMKVAKADLTLEAWEAEGEIRFTLEYSTALFERTTMERWSGHLLQMLASAAQSPDAKLMDLEVLSEEERMLLLEGFNATEASYPREKTLHALFEEQALRTPGHIAVVHGEDKLTYTELHHRVVSLAAELREYGVTKGTLVCVLTDRSVGMIVGLLAILEAGGAYVPIDPDYPEERIRYILEDSGASLLLARSSHDLTQVLPIGMNILELREDGRSVERKACLDVDERRLSCSEDLAYVIYTSGTTGKPKGVMIEHRNVVRLLMNSGNRFDFGDTDRWTMFHSYCFDFSVWEMYGALLYGGSLHIVPKPVAQDPQAMAELLEREGITVLNQTPTAFYPLIQAMSESAARKLALRYVIFGGEALTPSRLKPWRESYPGIKLVNMYGITETTVHVTYRELEEADMEGTASPIGKPLPTLRAYVRSPENGGLAPIGTAGELYIAGEGVARGYLNRAELTAERFFPDPYRPGERMYRTGDLARWLADGTLEYRGRIDDQVKIRGHRIELGEVAAQVQREPGIRGAAVIAIRDASGQQSLCVYYEAEETMPKGAWRRSLAQKLPEYMLPGYYVRMDRIPLTSNGKVDQKALPMPEDAAEQDDVYEPPGNETEEQLCRIWRDVLGLKQIGIEDHFFELGGHSLKAMNAITRIQAVFRKTIPLQELFRKPTIRELAHYLDQVESGERKAILSAQPRPYYPQSSAQKRIFVISQLEQESFLYNIPSALMLEGAVESERLSKALVALVRRHDILRTALVMQEGEPVQVIQEDAELVLEEMDGDGRSEEEHIRLFLRPFDLSQAPLVRVALVHLGPARSLLLTDMHHSIADGVSMGIWAEELMQLYDGGPEREKPRVQYKDYAVWQQELLASEAMKAQEQYWLSQFSGELPVLELPTDKPRPLIRSFAGDRIAFGSGTELGGKLKRLAEETGATLHMLLLAAYNVLLSRYTGQTDIVVGTPAAGRDAPETEGLIGMFVHTLALRNTQEPEQTFRSFVEKVKRNTLEAYEHQQYPFEKLVEQVQPQRDMSRHALYDVMLVVQNMELPPYRLGGLKVKPYPVEMKAAKADLTLEAWEAEGEIRFALEYSTALFERTTIERWSGHLLQLLASAAQSPYAKLKDLEVLSEEERMLLLEGFNATEAPYPRGKTLHALFEEQVTRTPSRTAIVFGSERISYEELNARSSRLSWELRRQGVRRGATVGVLAERSADLIVSFLAILKAGAAYVPIDPDYPAGRIRYILENSGASLLLARSGHEAKAMLPAACRLLELHEKGENGDAIYEASSWNDDVAYLQAAAVEAVSDDTSVMTDLYEEIGDTCGPSDLAYVIYTSGTTGKPKGVMVEHRGIVNTVWWRIRSYAFGIDSAVLPLLSVAFDAFAAELFAPLLSGGKVVLLSQEQSRNQDSIQLHIRQEGITHITATPSLFEAMLHDLDLSRISLDTVVLGGEAARPGLIARFAGTGIKCYNEYGPTENSVVTTFAPIDPTSVKMSIGKPIANTRVYLLDAYDRLAPIGVIGQLCVSGAGLARGYHRLSELTEEKFGSHLYLEGERLYRTGDLARWNEKGELEFFARLDEQLKIRGHRIETGEIVQALLSYSTIRNAAVSVREEGENRILCAYYVSAELLSEEEVKRYLSSELPYYMVPAHLTRLDRIPMTPNGKVDHQALPSPNISRASSPSAADLTEEERLLISVWENVLGLEGIQTNENFFELGGDSIKAIQISSRLKTMGFKLEVRDIFLRPVIRELAGHVRASDGDMDQQAVTGEVPLTPIQHWFFRHGFAQEAHWNQSMVLRGKQGFDPDKVAAVFQRMTEHHDALRMTYSRADGKVTQWSRAADAQGYTLSICDYKGLGWQHERMEAAVNEWQASFDLVGGPLVRLGLFQTDDGDHLVIIIHHLVVDLVSWTIILDDFAAGYGGAVRGERIHFPAKTHSYRYWAKQLEQMGSGRRLARETYYWEKVDRLVKQTLGSPGELVADQLQRGESGHVSVALQAEETDLLLKKIHHAYGTVVQDILLAALGTAITHWSGSEAVAIELEGHGRELGIPDVDVSRTVGWFTAAYPVVLRGGEPHRSVPETKEMLRQVPYKGIGYGILKYLTSRGTPAEEGMGSLAPRISFNYFGQLDQDMRSDWFEPSALPMGHMIGVQNKRTHEIDLNGAVRNKQLQFQIGYDSSRYMEESIQRLAACYRSSLLAIIEHCMLQGDAAARPISDEELSMDDLTAILDVLD